MVIIMIITVITIIITITININEAYICIVNSLYCIMKNIKQNMRTNITVIYIKLIANKL